MMMMMMMMMMMKIYTYFCWRHTRSQGFAGRWIAVYFWLKSWWRFL